jgi:hypothetical protein
MPQSFKDLGVTSRPLPVRTRMIGRAWPLRAPVRDGRVPSWQELTAGTGSSVMCMVSTSTVTFEPLCSLVIYWSVNLLEILHFFLLTNNALSFLVLTPQSHLWLSSSLFKNLATSFYQNTKS